MATDGTASSVRHDDRDVPDFGRIDPEEFARRYADWLDHEGGREMLESDMARTRRESVAMVRRLAGSPVGVSERF